MIELTARETDQKCMKVCARVGMERDAQAIVEYRTQIIKLTDTSRIIPSNTAVAQHLQPHPRRNDCLHSIGLPTGDYAPPSSHRPLWHSVTMYEKVY
jgi:hypothetical protein